MPIHGDRAWLGMYDLPALRPAQDAWWAGLAGHFAAHGLSNAPRRLGRSGADPYDIWLSPDLFMAQTCGYPLTHQLAGRVRLLGTPCYDAPGCEGANYRSLIIVRDESPAQDFASALPTRVAVNGRDSYSGWRALDATVATLGLDFEPFSEIIASGGHGNSIDLVREGGADLAAIDGVTFALIGDVAPERLAGVRILQQSAPAPGLPYVTRIDAAETEVIRMQAAIDAAFVDPELADCRRTLRLTGFSAVPLAEYERCMT